MGETFFSLFSKGIRDGISVFDRGQIDTFRMIEGIGAFFGQLTSSPSQERLLIERTNVAEQLFS